MMLGTRKRVAVYDLLRTRMQDGTYPVDSRLPNEPELAAELGVSRLTLRPVLAQLETENRLLRIKGKGTFVKDESRQKLRLLVIISQIPNFTQQSLLLGELQREADQHNAELELAEPLLLDQLSDAELEVAVRKKNFAGVVFIHMDLTGKQHLRPFWKQLQLPFVIFTLYPEDITREDLPENVSLITCNVEGMIQEALGYLANAGKRKVAISFFGNIRRIKRQKVLKLQKEFRLAPDRELFSCKESMDVFLERIFSRPHRPEAVCCGSSIAAAQVYRYLKAHGLRIPEDVAVIAIGNPPRGADLLTPSLCTVFCNYRELAEKTLAFLFAEIYKLDAAPPRRMVLKNYVFERESAAFFKKRKGRKNEECSIAFPHLFSFHAD